MQKNKTFQIFTGLMILFVVCGHIDLQLFSVFQLFPYYSFHVMAFVFVSGYFYKEEAEEKPVAYIIKKLKHLFVPYLLYNVVYGIIVTILHQAGFGFGSDLSINTLLIEPFVSGHQYMLNFASWFVPALFLIQLCNLFIRLICRGMRKLVPSTSRNLWELLIMTSTLLIGVMTVYLASTGHVWGPYKLPGRILFMLPAFEMGIFYRNILAKYNRLPVFIWLLIAVVVQGIIKVTNGGLAFSAVWCTGFANGPLVPYLTTVTGIVFWMCVAYYLERLPIFHRIKIEQFFTLLGANSFSVMMHHILGVFLLNGLFFLCYRQGVTICSAFDMHSYLYLADYYYLPVEGFKYLYLLASIAVPLAISYGVDKLKHDLIQRIF